MILLLAWIRCATACYDMGDHLVCFYDLAPVCRTPCVESAEVVCKPRAVTLWTE